MSIALEGMALYESATVDEEHRNSRTALAEADDEQLVAQAKSGDAPAFEALVRRYRNEVYALSYHFVRQRDTAWDLSQEVFIKAYKSLGRFRGDAQFKSWLMRITANQAKDYLKKRRLATAPFDEAVEAQTAGSLPHGRDALESRELGGAIERAVADLPHKHRVAFVLREYEGLSYQEMAEVMECSVGTVMSRLHHARKKLQHALIAAGMVEGR